MSYQSWSVVFGEQPSAAKWNILGTNDAAFNNGTGFAAGALGSDAASLANGIYVQGAKSIDGVLATGTTLIPNDDTIPQNTEGDQYYSVSITPKSTTNVLEIIGFMQGTTTAANNLILALFQDSTADSIGVNYGRVVASANPVQVIVNTTIVAGTTSATTIKLRAGLQSAGTLTVNGEAGARKMGGLLRSGLIVRERKSA